MEYDDLQSLFIDIKRGFNEFYLPSGELLYFKHQNIEDRVYLKKRLDFFISEAESIGIKKEKDCIDFYIDKGWWSGKKEFFIKEQSFFVENLKKSKTKLVLESQKKQMEETIREETSKLEAAVSERASIIPITAESYAERKYNRSYLCRFIFKDFSFKERLAKNEDYFLEIEDSEYDFFWGEVYRFVQESKTENIKYLAASGFLQNLLIIGGKDYSCVSFYGKPVVDLTTNQSDLFSYASFYRNYINNSTEKIPDYVLNEPISLISWCEGGSSSTKKASASSNKIINKNKTKGERSGRISSIVGATSEDYKALGFSDKPSVDLLSEAAKKGGSINIMDVVKATE